MSWDLRLYPSQVTRIVDANVYFIEESSYLIIGIMNQVNYIMDGNVGILIRLYVLLL